jgi:pimeloyl-ACP methyl ester carboxylesterase
LRRGILHNALQRPDGTWVWRYRRLAEPRDHPDFTDGWNVIEHLTVPLLLVRGMRPQSVVSDEDEAELVRLNPSAQVAHVEEAGHSVQGDAPVELAALIDRFTTTNSTQ